MLDYTDSQFYKKSRKIHKPHDMDMFDIILEKSTVAKSSAEERGRKPPLSTAIPSNRVLEVHDVAVEIFMFFDSRELMVYSIISKNIYAKINQDFIWQNIAERELDGLQLIKGRSFKAQVINFLNLARSKAGYND